MSFAPQQDPAAARTMVSRLDREARVAENPMPRRRLARLVTRRKLRAFVGGACTLCAVHVTATALAAQTPTGAVSPDTLTLSLAEVQRRAARSNLEFLSARQEVAIARGDLRQARVYRFNPDLALQATGGSLGSASPYELALTQEIEFAGQRGLRIRAARTGVMRASSVVRDAGRLTLADASSKYYRALAADQRLAVARDALTLTDRLLAAVRTQLREGEISALEANLAEIESGRARGRVLASDRLATSASLELKQVVGLPPDTPVRLAGLSTDTLGRAPVAHDPAMVDEDSLVALALARRPDLAASTAAVREFETLTSLARREGIPNLRVGAVVDRADGAHSPAIGPAVGLSLPLFNRNQGLVDQRRAFAVQGRLARQAAELRIRTEVADAAYAYRAASSEEAIFEASVLRPARENSELLETAFRAGKIALPTLLLLRNQLLDAELGYWDAWLARHEALVQLDAATGALLPPDFLLSSPSASPGGQAGTSRSLR